MSDDLKDILEYYKHESAETAGYEKMIYEATKYNFICFGTIFLIGNSWLLGNAINPKPLFYTACLVVAAISIGASAMALYFVKYVNACVAKLYIIEKAMWGRQPFTYIKTCCKEEKIAQKLSASLSIGFFEYLKSPYTMKWINLIPFIASVTLALLTAVGWLDFSRPPAALGAVAK